MRADNLRMRFTEQELAEAGERKDAERKAQGLAPWTTDPAVLDPLARELNVVLGAVVDEVEEVA